MGGVTPRRFAGRSVLRPYENRLNRGAKQSRPHRAKNVCKSPTRQPLLDGRLHAKDQCQSFIAGWPHQAKEVRRARRAVPLRGKVVRLARNERARPL